MELYDRVQVRVSDATETSNFVAFDTEITKLTNIHAADVSTSSCLSRDVVDKTLGLGPSTRSTGMVALERSHRLTKLGRSGAFKK